MATKRYAHNLDLLKVSQLVNARKQNVTTSERTALGATLGLANEGLFVWDTTEKVGYTWDGVQWVAEAAGGDIIPQLTAYGVTRQYFEIVDLLADVPLTVTHNLDLVDPNAFVIQTMHDNSEISLEVTSVDSDSLTLTSLVDFTDVSVTVIGAKAITP